MHPLHEPDSTRQIETVVDGETIRGTVQLIRSSGMTVKLDSPPSDLSTGSNISFFSRVPPGEPGYLGKYGERLALSLLRSLYADYKKGDRRREFAGEGCREFGKVRYLARNPGYPNRSVILRGKAPIDASVYVQIESDKPYRRARFFDSGTDQPFLAESAVCEIDIQEYVDGVKADLSFSRHLETVRMKMLPKMVRRSTILKTYQLNPYQADFLNDFGENWRKGNAPLTAAEIDQLIQLGYLTRNPGLAAVERAALEASLVRTRKAIEDFEAQGKENQAAQCRAKVQKVERRIDLKTLVITATGKAVAKKIPYQVDLD